ncbi:MAG TPA: hypothetical protein VFW71_02915 [Actinomycetota bacterium]|nr:hypothetical protein [Actinomycetota bacterium]
MSAFEPLGATMVTRLPRRSRRYPVGRTCAVSGCSTQLSAYNAGTMCYLHSPATAPRLRGRPDQLRSA